MEVGLEEINGDRGATAGPEDGDGEDEDEDEDEVRGLSLSLSRWHDGLEQASKLRAWLTPPPPHKSKISG